MREKQLGTAAWVLSKPVARSAFVLAKFVAYAAGFVSLAIIVPSAIFYGQSLALTGHAPALTALLAGVGVTAIHTLFYLALALLLGTLFDTRGPIAGIAMGVLFAGFLPPNLVPQAALLALPWTLKDSAAGLVLGSALPLSGRYRSSRRCCGQRCSWASRSGGLAARSFRPAMPTEYHIRLKGHLDDHWSEWFDNMASSNEANGEAVLRRPLPDQAALHGVLIKIRDLGLPLVAVTTVAAPDRPGYIQEDIDSHQHKPWHFANHRRQVSEDIDRIVNRRRKGTGSTMFNQLNSLVKASVYYAIALGLAVVVAAALVVVPGLGESLGEIDLYMLTPLAAVLLMLLVVTHDGLTRTGWKGLGLHQLGWRSWGMALLAPLFLFSCTYGIAWTTGIGRLDLSNLPGLVDVLFLLIQTTIFGLAEEIGWRGYLLPHLVPLGRRRALLLSGLLHGIWHLPVILLTSTYHENGDRLIVVSLFLLSLTAAGVLYGYLRLMSESVWPAALAHGSINICMTLFAAVTVAVSSPALLEYWAGESGVLTFIGITLLAGWLLYRLRRQPSAMQTVATRTRLPFA